MNDPKLLWDAKLVQEAEFAEFVYDDSVEAQDIDIDKILNYPRDQEALDFDAYAPPKAEAQVDADIAAKPLPAVEGMLGLWHGFTYWPKTSLYPAAGMISMSLKPSSAEGEVQHFTAADRANRTDFKVVGQCHAGDEPGTVVTTFKRIFPAHFPTQHFVGKWDPATDTLSGTVGLEEDAEKHYSVFTFKRMSPEHLCFTPAPVELETNKARALWGFAIAAVKYGVRRERWSWSFFKERRDNRRRFIELYMRSSAASTRFGTPLSNAEYEEMSRLKKTFSTVDCRWYHSRAGEYHSILDIYLFILPLQSNRSGRRLIISMYTVSLFRAWALIFV